MPLLGGLVSVELLEMGSQAYNLRVAALRTLEFQVCEAFVDDPWDDETEEEENIES